MKTKIICQVVCAAVTVGLLTTVRAQTTNAYTQAVLTDQPSVFYQFDESTGATVAVDSSGNGNDGLYNDVSLGNAGAASGLGSAVGFNGSNSLVSVPAFGSAFSLGGSGNDQFTIECWINPQSIVGGAIYAAPWQAGALNYLWDWNGPGVQFALNGMDVIGGGTTVFDSEPPMPTGQWSYVAAVYATSNVVVYVNGEVVGTNYLGGVAPISFDSAQIGAQTSAGGRYFDGQMEEFAIYTNVLSVDRIQAHYLAAVGPFIAITTQPQGGDVDSGQSVTFIAAASVIGTNELAQYQWRSNGVDIAGATMAAYTTPTLTVAANGASYDCVVTAPGVLSATTGGALVFVAPPVPYPSTAYSNAVMMDLPVVYYRFEEAGGTNVLDSSGNGNNGTYNDATLMNFSDTYLGYCVGFTNVNTSYNGYANGTFNSQSSSYATVPAVGGAVSLGGDGNDQFTIECWIKPKLFTADEALYTIDQNFFGVQLLWGWFASPNDIHLSVNGNTPGYVDWASSAVATDFANDEWTYLAVVYDDSVSSALLYVNGQLAGTQTFTTAGPVNLDPAQLGLESDGQNPPYDGLMDEFAIYTNVLSADRIQAHYLAGVTAPKGPTLSISQSGNGATISWSGTGYILQETTSALSIGNWVDVAGATNSPVTVPGGNEAIFYRLRNH